MYFDMKIFDLRSDTVTKPDEPMLEAMMKAEVGDDVFGDDPTVNQLEEYCAELFDKEAALFCPSGTMTNQIAINVHCRPGDEVMCDESAHVYQYEGGGIARNSLSSVKLIKGQQGIFNAQQVIDCINPDDIHKPVSKLVVIENTSNRGGGSIWPIEKIQSIRDVCDDNNLKLHLDGARLFNALENANYNLLGISRKFDSISICLSKGLGCPVGSVLIGDHEFIKQARRVRKVLGGGMRQAGFLAAAGIYALKNNIERLSEDKEHALAMANELLKLNLVSEIIPVQSNIVVAKTLESKSVADIIELLKKQGILAVPFGKETIRFVFHKEIKKEDIPLIFERLSNIAQFTKRERVNF